MNSWKTPTNSKKKKPDFIPIISNSCPISNRLPCSCDRNLWSQHARKHDTNLRCWAPKLVKKVSSNSSSNLVCEKVKKKIPTWTAKVCLLPKLGVNCAPEPGPTGIRRLISVSWDRHLGRRRVTTTFADADLGPCYNEAAMFQSPRPNQMKWFVLFPPKGKRIGEKRKFFVAEVLRHGNRTVVKT